MCLSTYTKRVLSFFLVLGARYNKVQTIIRYGLFHLKLNFFFNYCSLMNLLFIDLIAMLMSHKPCNRRQTKKYKKTQNKANADANVG